MYERLVERFKEYTVILRPDRDEPEWWAGAPSVLRTEGGTFFLAARMREGILPRGRRGYEVRILEGEDGASFRPICSIKREEVGIPGFERPSLVWDPKTGRFKLYLCGPLEHGWGILKLEDVDHPREFDPKTARRVLAAPPPQDDFVSVRGYKDPFVLWDGEEWHMFVIGSDRVERTYHFTSRDGEEWTPDPENPVLDAGGWHNFYTRPACVLPDGVGYLFVYEGSDLSWRDPVYNIATGLAYTLDLSHIVDLTPSEPLLRSTTPGNYHTWRYSHWLRVGERIYVYAEVACPDDTNEIRLFVL